MALRHVNVKVSALPTTGAIKLKIMTLLLQNVTDFSGYTNDPAIGAWLRSNSIAVEAYGDNLQIDVIEETASSITFRCGSLLHKLYLSGTADVKWESSINDGASYVGQHAPISTTQTTYRMADSYIATSWLSTTPVVASLLFFKHNEYGIRIQGPTSAVAFKADGTSTRINVLTPYGPIPDYAGLPAMVRSKADGVLRKALFPIQAAMNDSSLIEVSTDHSVLSLAYEYVASEYADQFTTNGTTYRVVGHFAFPS